MTLNDIVTSALAQLDRGHDPQTLDTWRPKFKHFANEAVVDLAQHLKLRKSAEVPVVGGVFISTALPAFCTKVLSVRRDGKDIRFTSGPGSGMVKAECPDGPVTVEYRYIPEDMNAATDKPDIPEHAHGLIVTYVVARERTSQDPSMQRGANVYFELYQAGKKQLRPNLGEEDTYKIKNRW